MRTEKQRNEQTMKNNSKYMYKKLQNSGEMRLVVIGRSSVDGRLVTFSQITF